METRPRDNKGNKLMGASYYMLIDKFTGKYVCSRPVSRDRTTKNDYEAILFSGWQLIDMTYNWKANFNAVLTCI